VQIRGHSVNDIRVTSISLKLSDHIACRHSSLGLSLLALFFLSNNSAIVLETVTSQSAQLVGRLNFANCIINVTVSLLSKYEICTQNMRLDQSYVHKNAINYQY